MNTKQKVVLWAAGILFVLSVCNAPWLIDDSREYPTGSGAYGIVLPGDKVTYERISSFRIQTSPVWDAPNAKSSLQIGQLSVEWAAIGVICFCLTLALRSKK